MKRSNPKSGIVKRRGVYWFNRTIKGHREWHNLETDDIFTAIGRKAELLRNPLVITARNSFESAIPRYIKWKLHKEKFRPITARNEASGLNLFAEYVGQGATLSSIRQSTVQKWYDKLRKAYMASTALKYLRTIQAMFKWAVDVERARNDNPVKGIEIVRPTSAETVRFASREIRDKLIQKAPNDDMRFILYAGFHAGLRMTEISEARVFWFDLEQGILHLQGTPLPRGTKWKGNDIVADIYGVDIKPFLPKGKKGRSIPLTKSFWEFLKGYLTDRKPEEFIGWPERTIAPGFYRWPFKTPFSIYMNQQGYGWISPHVMRYTFASLLVMKGVSLYKVATWLGDTLAVAEKHYARLAPLDVDIQHLE